MTPPEQAQAHYSPGLLIPVYNGRATLILLLAAIRKIVQLPIIVIDDGSTDGLSKTDLDPEVTFLQHQQNQGKGAALKTGLNQAVKLNLSHVITLDADGQHDPTLIPAFINRITESADPVLVVGQRDLIAGAMPFHRRLSNNLTSLILSLRSGLLIRDSQVGYRSYPLNDSRLWESNEDGFQFESAVFLLAAKLRLTLKWQPIPVLYGAGDSHMQLVVDTLRFVRTIFRSFLC